jgi:HicB family
MTVTIELRPEVEASLASLAAEQGISLTQYVRRLLEEQIPGQVTLSPAERANLWRESIKGLPRTSPLSDDAISRDSIYDARG